MTIRDLYDTCDNINLFTKVFIFDAEQNSLVWNKLFSEVQCPFLQLEVEFEHFKIIGDEVLIWVP